MACMPAVAPPPGEGQQHRLCTGDPAGRTGTGADESRKGHRGLRGETEKEGAPPDLRECADHTEGEKDPRRARGLWVTAASPEGPDAREEFFLRGRACAGPQGARPMSQGGASGGLSQEPTHGTQGVAELGWGNGGVTCLRRRAGVGAAGRGPDVGGAPGRAGVLGGGV